MPRSPWINSIFFCFGGGGGVAVPPSKATKAFFQNHKDEKSFGILPKHIGTDNRFIELIPILWAHLSGAERLCIRALCRDSRNIHDKLVTEIYVCDDNIVLSGIPAARLPRYPVPTIQPQSAQEVVSMLQGFTARGCQPHLLFLCLAEGHERRRHEEGLAVLLTLSDAANDLSAVHLCGLPLTPQVARALKTLLPSPPSPLSYAAAAATKCAAAPPQPPPAAAPSNLTITSIASTATPRSLTAVSTGPPAAPLSLSLYGYDLARQPAAIAVEMVVAAAAPRLARLELWGCVGWPKRLGTLLQGCAHLRHVAVSFQPLLPPDGAVSVAGGGGGRAAGASPQRRAAAALASGAVIAFAPIAAAATTAAVVKTVGGLHHLRSLELRGCVLNLVRRASSDNVTRAGGGYGGAAGRPRTGAASRAAAERAAVVAAAPSVQQLASALYQLTRLTRLAIDNLNSAAPLLTAVAAMRGLRHLELPDAAAPTAVDLAAIARAAPRLASLTLGSIGAGSVLDAGGSAAAAAAAAATAAPEVLPLPPGLAVLRVARCRPTLRTMRSLRRTVEARGAAPAPAPAPSPSSAAVGAARDIAAAAAAPPPRLAVVVPGIEIDMLDVEYDALQGFSRGSDGVLRSTLLPESAEALAAAIRLLAPPAPSGQGWDAAGSAAAGLDAQTGDLGGGGGVAASGAIPSSVVGSGILPSYSLGGAAAGASSFGGAASCRFVTSSGDGFGGGRFVSTYGGGGSGIVSTFGGSFGGLGGEEVRRCSAGGGDADWAAPPAFGQTWTRELTIHNSQGSLGPPSPWDSQLQLLQRQRSQAAATAEAEPTATAGSGGPPGPGDAATAAGGAASKVLGCEVEEPPLQQQHCLPLPPLTGHAVWITEMRPLGLLSLELYGIGVMAGDLEAVAELEALRRLTLASGELEVDWLPVLSALPALDYLELTRCHPCRHRHRRGGGGSGSRASTGAGFARASGGAGFARASGAGRVSYVSDSDAAADGDGESAARPSGKRALLELCMTAPALRRVFVVRCTGMVTRSEGAEGPLGAEWVRQRLLAAGPRYKPQAPPSAASASAAGGEEAAATAGLNRTSWLGRLSRPVVAPPPLQVSEADLGWPEVRWD